MYVCMYVCICICIHTTFIFVFIFSLIFMFVFMFTYLFVTIYIYIYIYQFKTCLGVIVRLFYLLRHNQFATRQRFFLELQSRRFGTLGTRMLLIRVLFWVNLVVSFWYYFLIPTCKFNKTIFGNHGKPCQHPPLPSGIHNLKQEPSVTIARACEFRCLIHQFIRSF